MIAGALKITLLSDAVFGRGEGLAGEVDTEVEHDAYGLPVLQGKLLRGALRDVWLRMADWFPELHDGALLVFGVSQDTTADTALRIASATVPADLRALVHARQASAAHRGQVLDAFTVRREQTARDRDGVYARGSLRSVRALRRNLVLEAPLSWSVMPTDEARLVLKKACAALRHLGLSRNRGLGHLRVELLEAADRPAVEERPQSGPLPGTDVTYVPIQLDLADPAILTRPDGTGGAQTYDFVPGSTLQGLVAAALRRAGGADVETQIAELVLSDDVAYLDALPQSEDRPERALVAPAGWRVQRDDDADAIFDAAGVLAQAGEIGDAEPVEGSFAFSDIDAQRVDLLRGERLHHARDRARGRADDSGGTLFSYQSIDGGQRLVGAVALGGEPDARARRLRRLSELLQGEDVLIGRSRTAGYGGRARVTLLESEAELDRPEPGVEDDLEPGELFGALLLSDYAGRDPRTGQHDPAHLGAELSAALGGRATVLQVIGRFDRRGAFNRHAGLPTPVTAVYRSGTEVVLRCAEPINRRDLERIAAAGIGERRSTGFGRLAWRTVKPVDALAGLEPRDQLPHLTAEVRVAAPARRPADLDQLEIRLAERLLDDAVRLRARVLADAIRPVPTGALIGRLRNAVLTDGWAATVIRWMDQQNPATALKAGARKQLDRARIDGGGKTPRNLATLIGALADAARRDDTLADLLDWRWNVDDAVFLDGGPVREHVAQRSGAVARSLLLALLAELSVTASEADS